MSKKTLYLRVYKKVISKNNFIYVCNINDIFGVSVKIEEENIDILNSKIKEELLIIIESSNENYNITVSFSFETYGKIEYINNEFKQVFFKKLDDKEIDLFQNTF